MFKNIIVALLIVLSLVGLISSQSFAQSKALQFHSVPTTSAGTVACWSLNSTTGTLVLSSCSTITATSVVVTGATTTTCTFLKTVTITNGIITAATCSL